MSKIVEAGRALYSAYRERRPFSLMQESYAPLTLDEAYAIQAVYTEFKAENSSGFGGYKIAYSTRLMQNTIGATEPAYGRILKSDIHPTGVSLNTDDYVQLAVECEVAVHIITDLVDGPFDEATVMDAIGEIALAFEIVDRRPFLGEKSLLQSVAMNVIGAGVVLGRTIRDWRDLDIPASECRLSINDEIIGRGRGADVDGHPVNPVIWLANALAAKGEFLRRGDLIITGSMIPPQPVHKGDRVSLTMDNLGTVTIET
jgi:2-keto-4-pentenoate hydratase